MTATVTPPDYTAALMEWLRADTGVMGFGVTVVDEMGAQAATDTPNLIVLYETGGVPQTQQYTADNRSRIDVKCYMPTKDAAAQVGRTVGLSLHSLRRYLAPLSHCFIYDCIVPGVSVTREGDSQWPVAMLLGVSVHWYMFPAQ